MKPWRQWRIINRNEVEIGRYWTYAALIRWINGPEPRRNVRYRIEHWEDDRWRYRATYYRQ